MEEGVLPSDYLVKQFTIFNKNLHQGLKTEQLFLYNLDKCIDERIKNADKDDDKDELALMMKDTANLTEKQRKILELKQAKKQEQVGLTKRSTATVDQYDISSEPFSATGVHRVFLKSQKLLMSYVNEIASQKNQ